MPKSPMPDVDKKTQSDKFIEAARKLECDESEERFDDALRKVAKSSPSKPRLATEHKKVRP